jgi:hypothetical protein
VQRPLGKRQENEDWNQWDQQRLNRKNCNLDAFYGPASLPDKSLPCAEELRIVMSFEKSHRAYMLKHMNHLFYMKGLVERLILQSEQKIKGLIYILKSWEEFPDFRKSTLSQSNAVRFPFQGAPALTIQSNHHVHTHDEQEDVSEDIGGDICGYFCSFACVLF